MNPLLRTVLLSVPFLVGAQVAAQAQASWRSSPVNVRPAVTSGDYTLTALSGGDLFLFGGTGAAASIWSGTHWSQVAVSLPPRSAHAAAIDEVTGDLVIHGGLDPLGAPIFDTWRFDGASWQQVATTMNPPSLTDAMMAYDPATQDLVLIGRTTQQVHETWRFDGDWSAVSTASLPTSTTSAAIYTDSVRGTVSLFARTATGFAVRVLEAGVWVERATYASSTGFGLAAFDATRGRAVYLERNPTGNRTFEFDGLTIRPVGGANSLGTGSVSTVAFDARRGEVMLGTNGPQVDLWSWSPRPAAFTTAYGDPCVNPQLRLGMAAGDAPTLGATHRLVAPATAGALTFVGFGFSHTFYSGVLPRPLPGSACLLRVATPTAALLPGTVPTLPVTVPNLAALLAVRYDAQCFVVDATGLMDTSNGLEVQIGWPVAANVLAETFATSAGRDPVASGDVWANGIVTPTLLGGDGRHGSFDPSHGVMTAPNTWQWDTDNMVIPATATLSGASVTVTDGRFAFTDFVLPAGATVDFVGSAPAQLFARGRVEVAGRLRLNGAAMTTFDARGVTNNPAPFVNGQPGGAAGAGGGAGGRGGNECQGAGPIIVGGEVLTNGANGDDVQLVAGHAYAAQAVGTGGRGSSMNPPTGPAAPNTPLVGFVYRAFFASGGSGGGFSTAGTTATVTPLTNLQIGASPAAGIAFSPLPVPVGATSLEHFAIGGAGGGGGGTHAFGTIYVSGDVYIAGAAGSGGGGACAIRSGGALEVLASGGVESKGGAGALINGRNPAGNQTNVDWGVASPGGGGSGGSVLLQSASTLTVAGAIDTSGGAGSSNGSIGTSSINVQSQAGAGAPGYFRLEAAGTQTQIGTTVPAFNAGIHSGPLTDRDDHTGSRSIWLRPAVLELPRYVRYELVATVNSGTVLYSDDPAISNVAADDPNGAVYLRFQGAQADVLTGEPLAATIGPWRTEVREGHGSLNSDIAELVRFDLVLNKAAGAVTVRELRVIWR